MPPIPFKKLTRAEELALFRRWRKSGDRAAYEALVESQFCWAKRLAQRYAKRLDADFEELESLCYFAVLKAVEKFDPTRKARLTTLVAVVARTLVDKRDLGGPIRLPDDKRRLEQKFPAQLRAALKWTSLKCDAGDGVSYDHNEPMTAGDACEALADREQLAADLERLGAGIAELPDPRMREVLRRRFVEQQTLRETGASFGKTREWARQLERKALAALRDYFTHLRQAG